MCLIAVGRILTNSGTLAAYLSSLNRFKHTGGLSIPFSSMWVRNISVNGVLTFDVNSIHFPLGEKLCQELNSERLHRIFLALPPLEGMIKRLLSGCSMIPVRLWVQDHPSPIRRIPWKIILPCCSSADGSPTNSTDNLQSVQQSRPEQD